MKSKLKYLVGVSLKRKIKNKWFVFANLALAILLVGLINIDSIISFFGGDFDKKTTVYVIDHTEKAYDIFSEQLKVSTEVLTGKEDSSYIIEKFDGDYDAAKKQLEENKDKNIVLVFNKDEEKVVKVQMLTKEYMDIVDTQLLTNAINNTKVSLAIYESDISLEEINQIYEPAEIERLYLDENKNNADENMQMIMTTVFPILILPFFMLTLFLVQMIGAEINDEKTTRGMEIIISNVSPRTHFFSKMISGNVFVILQGVLLFLYGAVGLLVRHFIGGDSIVNGVGGEVGKVISDLMASGFAEKLAYIIPLTLFLMLLTFLAYSLLAGILASMTTNIENFQQLQTPIILVSLVGYYLAVMAGMFEGATFIKVLSFIPLISAILAPSLLVLGQIGIVEVVIAILITAVFNYLLIRYGLKIYKVGILNYSSEGLWKKMIKALKN